MLTYLLIVVFLHNGDVQTKLLQAPSAAVCAADLPKFQAAIDANSEVRHTDLRCISVSPGDKV